MIKKWIDALTGVAEWKKIAAERDKTIQLQERELSGRRIEMLRLDRVISHLEKTAEDHLQTEIASQERRAVAESVSEALNLVHQKNIELISQQREELRILRESYSRDLSGACQLRTEYAAALAETSSAIAMWRQAENSVLTVRAEMALREKETERSIRCLNTEISRLSLIIADLRKKTAKVPKIKPPRTPMRKPGKK